MTQMAPSELTDISIDNAAGTPTAVEGEVGSGGISVEYEIDDAIALSDDAKGHTLGHRDGGEFNMDGVYTRTRWTMLAERWRAPVSTKTFTVIYKPDGNEIHTFETIATGLELTSDEGGTAQLTESNKVTGAIVLTAAV